MDSSQWSVDSKFGPVRLSWYVIVPVALASAAIAVPWLMGHAPEIGFALQRGFAQVCHQQAERSFILFGGSVAVCSRCLGIYLGATVGLLMRVSRRVAWRWLMAAAAMNVIDRLAEVGGLHGNWMLARFALGIGLGTAAAMFVSAANRESPAATALFRSTLVQRGRI